MAGIDKLDNVALSVLSLGIGDQVVSLVDWETDCQGVENVPSENRIYSIRGFCDADDLVGLWLEEIVNKPVQCWPSGQLGERAFNIIYFRPAKKTNIDVFTSLLVSGPKELV